MRRVRGVGASKEVAPDESCEADASGLASFSLCEGDGETASPDSANVTSFFGVGVRTSSSELAASPIGKACGVDWLTWGAGGGVSELHAENASERFFGLCFARRAC